MTDIEEFINGQWARRVKPAEDTKVFEPYKYFCRESNSVKVFFKEGQDYAKVLNEYVTLYLSIETDEVLGVQINNLVEKYNGGQKCDMDDGPCSCGAWH